MAIDATTYNDAELEEAFEAKAPPRSKTFFGQMRIDHYKAVLIPGRGKVPYDPGVHSADQMVHALKLSLDSLPSAPKQYTIDREMIAESREFDQYLRKSLTALGIRLQHLRGAYVQVEMPPTRKYRNASGEEKEATTFVVKAIYPDLASAEEASAAHFRRNGPHQPGDGVIDGSTVHATPPAPRPVELTPEQRRQALETMYRTMGGDVQRFLGLLAGMPPFAHLTQDDPEIQAVIASVK